MGDTGAVGGAGGAGGNNAELLGSLNKNLTQQMDLQVGVQEATAKHSTESTISKQVFETQMSGIKRMDSVGKSASALADQQSQSIR